MLISLFVRIFSLVPICLTNTFNIILRFLLELHRFLSELHRFLLEFHRLAVTVIIKISYFPLVPLTTTITIAITVTITTSIASITSIPSIIRILCFPFTPLRFTPTTSITINIPLPLKGTRYRFIRRTMQPRDFAGG